jgi:alpha-beta hydrolase superfamily lysophospholipase
MLGEIRNAQSERLDYTFHPAASGAFDGLAVLGHGVTGNKDRPFLVILADGLAAAGIDTIRFSFSGNGESDGSFSQSTITKEVADLGAVLNAVDAIATEKAGRPICYIGHSMGGAVGILRAALDPRLRWLVSLAGMVHTRAFTEREFGDVTPGQGFMWDEPDCPLSQTFVDDMHRIDSVLGPAGEIAVPWLLVHGTDDDVVPVQDSIDVVAKAGDPKPRFQPEFGTYTEATRELGVPLRSLVQIEAANHVFGDEAAAEMVTTVVDWVVEQMGMRP